MAVTNLKQVALYLSKQHKAQLDRLHERTRIPRTVLLREALEDLFKKHAHLLTKARSKR